MGEHWHMALLINHVDYKPIACFHQGVQIRSTGVYCHPPRVVPNSGSIDATNKCELARWAILFVCPDLVCPHVRRVKVSFGRIKDHSMHLRVGLVLVVLDVCLHATIFVDREDVAIACMVVEWVSIDVIRRFLCGQDEDGSRIRVGAGG